MGTNHRGRHRANMIGKCVSSNGHELVIVDGTMGVRQWNES